MNFPFDTCKLLPEEITKVDNKLQLCRQNGQDRYGYQELKKMLFEVVDKMGHASAKAQGLTATITTGSKMENSNHHLYIMKDVSGEKSCVVGILKVGTKKLFVYDASKRQHELDPLCVLDFYVHESRQRMGCGKKLFEFMLARENIRPQHMAVDRPSPKFQSFLKKHYRLHGQIPQVNNFVIFEGFFNNRNESRNRQSRFNSSGYVSNTGNRSSRPNSGRKSQTPQTPMSALHLQSSPQQQPSKPTPPPQQQIPRPETHGNYPTFDPTATLTTTFTSSTNNNSKYGNRQSPNYMAAGERMYSRHSATPPNPAPHSNRMATPPSANHNQLTNGLGGGDHYHQSVLANNSRSSSSSNKYNNNSSSVVRNDNDAQNKTNNVYDINYNKMSSPYMQFSMGATKTATYYDHNNNKNVNTNTNCPSNSNRSAPNFSSRNTPQNVPYMNGISGTGSANGAVFLPDITSGNSSRQLDMGNQQINSIAHLPPSGKRINPAEPPRLQRDGPPAEYKDMFNMHQAYQGRNGRFLIPETVAGASGTNPPSSLKPPHKPSTNEQSYGYNNSVTGYLREQRMKQNVSNRYNPGRLW